MKAFRFTVIGRGDDAEEAWLNVQEYRVVPEVERVPEFDTIDEDDDEDEPSPSN